MIGGITFWQYPGADAEYALAAWLFLRVLGLVYLAAFVSLAVQVRGMIGSGGIMPARGFLESRRSWQPLYYIRTPTLCWLNCSDGFLVFLCWGGAVLSLALIVGAAPVLVLILLWIIYLSLLNVSGRFLAYQWDILLLETGFLAIFLAPHVWFSRFPPASEPSPVIVWLLWWLLFRLMVSSGLAKLRSGDRSWRTLTALHYHYETQPLPTPLSWHAHGLPKWFHKLSAALMFGIEIVVPLLFFAPPPIRYWAALLTVFLMAAIALTGNYCFFNLLACALCLMLVDDAILAGWVNVLWPGAISGFAPVPAHPVWTALTVPVGLLVLVLSLEPLGRLAGRMPRWPVFLQRLGGWLEPYRLVNGYGLFSVMTTERPEIIVEGSHDLVLWKEYEFKWKPGDVRRSPRFAAPHQPRLDWQMWFAALGQIQGNPWLVDFLGCLLRGTPEVLRLLGGNPFPDGPPRFVRARVFDYRFTDRKTRRACGAWWRREARGLYCPVVTLAEDGRVRPVDEGGSY